MYTMTVAPGADASGSFYSLKAAFAPDGIKRGTFRSYTFFVHAADVTLRNLTIENTAGDSKTHGQAIALYAECDRFVAESCRIS